jgi:hypothetical protein
MVLQVGMREDGESIQSVLAGREDKVGHGNQHDVFLWVREEGRRVLKWLSTFGEWWDYDDPDTLEEDCRLIKERIGGLIAVIETKIHRAVGVNVRDGCSDESVYTDRAYVMDQPFIPKYDVLTNEDVVINDDLRDIIGQVLEACIKLWDDKEMGIDLTGGELMKAYFASLVSLKKRLPFDNLWAIEGEPTLVDVKTLRPNEVKKLEGPLRFLVKFQYGAVAAVLRDAGYEFEDESALGGLGKSGTFGRVMWKVWKTMRWGTPLLPWNWMEFWKNSRAKELSKG